MAPTPITVIRNSASLSSGTKSCCRTKRSLIVSTDVIICLRRDSLEVHVIPKCLSPPTLHRSVVHERSVCTFGCLVIDYRLRWYLMNMQVVLALPGHRIRCQKWSSEIDIDRNFHVRTWANVVAQASIGRPASSQNEHHRPVGPPKDPGERRLIRPARLRRLSGMRMNPYARELFRSPPCIDLLIKQLGYPLIVEFDMGPRTGLLHEA